jgi:hypothetical protein
MYADAAPKIDPRSYDEIVKPATWCGSTPAGSRPSDTDAGAALIRVFGRMVEQVIER